MNRIIKPPVLKKVWYALPLMVAAMLFACRKEQKDFPADTTEGRNSFGCYVDGVVFLPCAYVGGLYGTRPVEGKDFTWPYRPGRLPSISVNAVNFCDNKALSFSLAFDSLPLQTGARFLLGNAHGRRTGSAYLSYRTATHFYGSDSSLPGSVLVTRYDSVGRILSGQFEGRLRSREDSSEVTVSTGKFDVRF